VAAKATLIGRTVYGARNAFAHLAAALERHGLLGKTVDFILVEEDPEETARREAERGRKVAILYGLSTPVFLELAEEVARVARRFPVIAGGPHAEGAYWQLLRIGVWAAVVGDGENALPALVEALMGERTLDDVPNIAYSPERGSFRVTRIEHVNLDEYKPYHEGLALYPPIEIMRGCPYRCRFCQVPWLFKARVRFRGLDAVLDAVKAYVAAGRRRIRFIAPIGFAYLSPEPGRPNPGAIEALLKGVRSLGGTPFLGSFPSETRPEYVTRDVLEVLKRYAGNRRVSIGLQSGSNRVLELSGRGHTVEEALEAIELVRRYGFTPVVDIIFGLPGERDEDVEATVDVMYKLASMGAKLRLHTFLPLPGTPFAQHRPRPLHPLYQRAVQKLLGRGVLEGDWVDQEELAVKMYCLTMYDPVPSPEPATRKEEEQLCASVWRRLRSLIASAG
jgi:B12-binding domain/radical SAM domain protein